MVQEKEKKQEDKDVQKFRTSWEVSRYLAKHIWNSQGRTLKRLFKKDTDFEKFYWEVEERVNKKQQSQSEMKTILMGFAAGLKTIKKKKS